MLKRIYFRFVIVPLDIIRCYKKQLVFRKSFKQYGIKVNVRSRFLKPKRGYNLGACKIGDDKK